MDQPKDTFKTLKSPSEVVLFKDRKSKFYGYAFPVSDETSIKSHLEDLRKKHPTANHVCYGWQLGVTTVRYRANDDGEPNNSAGMPIYGQLQAFEVTNILVAVVRFFGGTKLGVGGLINAYRTTAKMALEVSEIIEKVIHEEFRIVFEYHQMDKVMRLIKQHQIQIIDQKMDLKCMLHIGVRKKQAKLIEKELMQNIRIETMQQL